MANIKSSKKRIELSRRQHDRNSSRKSGLRTYTGRFNEAIEENNVEEAEKLLKVLDKKLKKATLKGVIHENAASRRLSRFQRKLNEVKA